MFSCSPKDPRCPFKNSKPAVMPRRTRVISESPQKSFDELIFELTLAAPDSAHLQGFPVYHEKPHRVPTVACFIPNLHHGCPFRVSLLRWQPPIASRKLQAMAPSEEMILFEARVLLDGMCVAYVDPRHGLVGELTRYHQWAPIRPAVLLASGHWYVGPPADELEVFVNDRSRGC